MDSQPINLITPLQNLKANAASRFSPFTGEPSDFVEGYLLGINHALELAEIQQIRIARRQQEGK